MLKSYKKRIRIGGGEQHIRHHIIRELRVVHKFDEKEKSLEEQTTTDLKAMLALKRALAQ